MDLPALIPPSMQHLSALRSDQALFETLVPDLASLILFFESAVDDETWSQSHGNFLKNSIEWMTARSFEDTLSIDIAKRAAIKIQEHYRLLEPILPKNLNLIVNGSKHMVNSLLWSSSSSFWHERIRRECRDLRKKTLSLPKLSPFVFGQISQYVTFGKAETLWRHNEEEIIEVLEQAKAWRYTELSEICQALLEKYITKENALETLLKIHSKDWGLLKKYCIQLINDQDLGVKFDDTVSTGLGLEFLNFDDPALKIFEAVRSKISKLSFGGDLTDHPKFSEIVNRCPGLISVDISATVAFTERLLDIPSSLQELDLSRCEWLSNQIFKQLVQKISRLTKLGLSGNKQLKFTFWGVLKELPDLQKLDLSSCSQISDEDFRLILQACRGVSTLLLNACTGLTDYGFLELGKTLPRLLELDIGRTNLSDSGLMELVLHCPHLRILKVARCPYLTDKSVLEILDRAAQLEVFDCTKCHISQETAGKVLQKFPPG